MRAISVLTTPPGARLLVDGQPRGTTPALDLLVPRSTVTITVSRGGQARVIVLPADSDAGVVRVDLDDPALR